MSKFFPRRGLPLAAALAVALSALASAPGARELGPPQFRQDLRFFARELPRRHKNAFHYTTRERFQSAVDELAARLDTVNADAFFVGLMRIAAMIGDAHTRADLPRGAVHLFPIIVRDYDGAFRVLQALPGYEKTLGARLVKIDDTPAARFYPLLSDLVTQNENPSLTPPVVGGFLRIAEILHGAGIAARADTARYTFQDDSGRQFALDLPALPLDRYQNAPWVPIAPNPLAKIAEPLRNPAPAFSFTYVPAARAVYANVRSMRDVKAPAAKLFQFIRERHPDRLIVDLRQNPGGNYFHGLHGLIEPIARLADLNRKGHLFVLIGPLTGSAAIINAAQFHTKTQALLVGEPIGARPSEYAELKTMSLPNTRFVIGYSVKFYDFSYNQENVVRPDHEIKPLWEDVKSGRSPALEWCLDFKAE